MFMVSLYGAKQGSYF